MPTPSPGTSARLRLRGGEVDARLVWPADAPTGMLVLLVGELEEGEHIARRLSNALGVVSLVAPFQDGATAVVWAADHAAQLGVRSGRLMLGGLHAGVDAAVQLAARAREDGWPDLILANP